MLVIDALGEIRLTHPMELIDEILDSGTNAIAVTLCDPKTYGETALNEALTAIIDYDRHLETHRDRLMKATTTDDADAAASEGRLGVYYQLQNATPIQRELDRVEILHGLGVRSIQLTYNYQNYVGSGCRERDDRGVSAFGRELIERMNEVGVLIDTSHASMATMKDAIEMSDDPIIISHTCCETVQHHIRNTTDDNLRRLAEHGGVVGICQIRPFVSETTDGALERYFAHLDHAVNVAGIDHVAIGSDRDHRVIEDDPEEIRVLQEEEGAQFQPEHWPLYIDELNGPRRMEVVLGGLEKRGYTGDRLEKIAGQNLKRLYRDVIG